MRLKKLVATATVITTMGFSSICAADMDHGGTGVMTVAPITNDIKTELAQDAFNTIKDKNLTVDGTITLSMPKLSSQALTYAINMAIDGKDSHYQQTLNGRVTSEMYSDYNNDTIYLTAPDNKLKDKWYAVNVKNLYSKYNPALLAKYEKEKAEAFAKKTPAENAAELKSIEKNIGEHIQGAKLSREAVNGDKYLLETKQFPLASEDKLLMVQNLLEEKVGLENKAQVQAFLNNPKVKEILTKDRQLNLLVGLNKENNTIKNIKVYLSPLVRSVAYEAIDAYVPQDDKEKLQLVMVKPLISELKVNADINITKVGTTPKIVIPAEVLKHSIKDINKFPPELKAALIMGTKAATNKLPGLNF